MRRMTRSLTGIGLASLMLAGTPWVSMAAESEVALEQTVVSGVSTVSTSGDPATAAMINAGTLMWVQWRQAAASRSGDIEVAGVQTSPADALGPNTVSTSGDPATAAMLNAGTQFWVAYRSGQVTRYGCC